MYTDLVIRPGLGGEAIKVNRAGERTFKLTQKKEKKSIRMNMTISCKSLLLQIMFRFDKRDSAFQKICSPSPYMNLHAQNK